MNVIFYMISLWGLVIWVENPLPKAFAFKILRKHPGDEMEAWLKKFHLGAGELGRTEKLPFYKFYGELIELLLGLARKFGGNYQETFLFLKEGLQLDRQFERKINELLWGVTFQIAAMLFLTWGFIAVSLHMVDVKLGSWPLVLIFLWQGIGMSLVPIVVKKLRRFYFHDSGKIWRMLYVLKSLTSVPIPRSEILELAGISHLKTINSSNLSAVKERLIEACEKTLKWGKSYDDEVKYLMDEMRFIEKWHFELFQKRLGILKLVILSLFFLPSYLAFIFLLMSQLMAIM